VCVPRWVTRPMAVFDPRLVCDDGSSDAGVPGASPVECVARLGPAGGSPRGRAVTPAHTAVWGCQAFARARLRAVCAAPWRYRTSAHLCRAAARMSAYLWRAAACTVCTSKYTSTILLVVHQCAAVEHTGEARGPHATAGGLIGPRGVASLLQGARRALGSPLVGDHRPQRRAAARAHRPPARSPRQGEVRARPLSAAQYHMLHVWRVLLVSSALVYTT